MFSVFDLLINLTQNGQPKRCVRMRLKPERSKKGFSPLQSSQRKLSGTSVSLKFRCHYFEKWSSVWLYPHNGYVFEGVYSVKLQMLTSHCFICFTLPAILYGRIAMLIDTDQSLFTPHLLRQHEHGSWGVVFP